MGAVSNSIGSNVFDILLGLAAPWACQMVVATLVPPPPCQSLAQFTETVVINSSGLVISCSMLLASLVFVVAVIHFNGWKLNFKAGILISIGYLLFIIGAVLNENSAAGDDGMTCKIAIENTMLVEDVKGNQFDHKSVSNISNVQCIVDNDCDSTFETMLC